MTALAIHHTASRGWMNDPHGVVWFDGAYHLFYQWVPDSLVWSPQCRWGHAVSPDLVHWRELPPALVPAGEEIGCWSGTSVVTDAGELDLFYTRVFEGDLGHGQIVRARPSGDRWVADPAPAVVPPPELAVINFRDPCIFRYEDHWVMVVGAGLGGGVGALVQFTSPDLSTWTYTGLVASRSTDETAPVWSGSTWECPQFFPIGDTWVLVVSVWHDETLHHCAAATGSYDGRTFAARHWQQFTFGTSAYAMTSFVDCEGRRCVMSWLRERPDHDPGSAVRTGAHSVPYLVVLDESGSVRLEVHPDVALLRGDPAPPGAEVTGPVDLEIDMAGTATARLLVSDGTEPLFDAELAGPSRVIVDGDVVEVCTGGGLTVSRPASPPTAVTVEGADVRAWVLESPWAGQ